MSSKKLLAALAGVALGGAAYSFLARRSNDAASTADARSGYVNPAACGGCHQEIAKTYRLTGMGRSLYRPRAENRVEDYKTRNRFYHRASDRYYTMLDRGGKWYQRRHQIDFDGKETNFVEKQVDFVIGSGNHARSYLHRTAEGKLVQLPVTWYAEKGGYWAMSPGYDRPDQEDFRRTIPDECMFCHNAYPMVDQMPEGIDCQRCHGPGEAHVAAAGSGRATRDTIRLAIVNPARLNRDRQLEICMQCHLETTSRPLPNAIRRYNRPVFSYRPGELLSDYLVYFDHAPGTGHDDKFEIAHAAYRLRQSACFQASQMTCTTCHNPHRIERGNDAVRHHAGVCRSCHASVHSSGMPAAANCIECHMPKRRADDAVHVIMTDHFIQRRKPSRDLLASLEEVDDRKKPYRGEVILYYPPQLPRTPESELYLADAQVQHGAGLESGIAHLRNAIEKYAPGKAEFYFELGKAYSKTGNHNEAVKWYEEALRRRGDFPLALKGLATTLFDAGRLARAAEVMERTLAAPSPDPVILINLGNAYLRQGKLARAEQVLQQALTINLDLPDANNLLGLVRLQKGDGAGAGKYFRNAICVQPDLAAAHNNLANLLSGAGDYAQASYHFEKAIANDPAYVEAHHSYGLFHVLMRSYDKALFELREAVRLDPNLAQAHSDLADVLTAQGQLQSAVHEYRLALRLRPEMVEADFGLGRVLAAQGKQAEAEQQFRFAVQKNPRYYEAHLALGLILARKGNLAEARAHYEQASQSTDPFVRETALKALR